MTFWGRLTALALAVATLGTVLRLVMYEPTVVEGSVVTREGIVIDRAMSDGLPYISVEFEDGTAVCCWKLHRDVQIPQEVSVGDRVRVSYGVEETHGRYAVRKVEEITDEG